MICRQLLHLSESAAKLCFNGCLSSATRQLSLMSAVSSSLPLTQPSAQNLVIDLSFDDMMTSQECHRLARDLYSIYCLNSCLNANDTTFRVNVCNEMTKNGITLEYLKQYLPIMQTNSHFKVHNKSYLDLFSAERLVYLSPDSKDVIDFNADDIYIMGGIVEKNIYRRKSSRVTLAKAKKEGLRVGRLPIDHIVSDDMKRGIVLFLPQVFRILGDVKVCDDWERAARRHLPFWKLKPLDKQHNHQCL